MQVVLPGFSVRLICFVQAKTVCRYGCMHFFAALVIVCIDVMVITLFFKGVRCELYLNT